MQNQSFLSSLVDAIFLRIFKSDFEELIILLYCSDIVNQNKILSFMKSV